MHVTFTYDPSREVVPLRFGMTYTAGGQRQLTAFEQRILAARVDPADVGAVASLARVVLDEHGVDVGAVTRRYKAAWLPHEAEVLRRFQRMFATDWDPGQVAAYLTVSKRCPYNVANRLFFVSFLRTTYVANSLHELQHFFVHELYENDFAARGLGSEFPHFKESLTVLLNEAFADIMEAPDAGYEMHAERRQRILERWRAGETIRAIAASWQ